MPLQAAVTFFFILKLSAKICSDIAKNLFRIFCSFYESSRFRFLKKSRRDRFVSSGSIYRVSHKASDVNGEGLFKKERPKLDTLRRP